ncbi:MAG TPA: polyprenyl synthetase family protein [Terriglobia bacterium]|nr:polyprenyl synthetase family protein [Terriglobia bacterium]
MTPQEIYGLIAPEMSRVEDELRAYTRSPVKPIADIGSHLLNAGGKRIRPALLLLTARMLGAVSDGVIRLAAVMEFLHNATLVHDDIIDQADTRRGQPTANARWGNAMTVLAGDWLYMQSFAVALGERNLSVLDTLIQITQKMVEGELLQLTFIGRSEVSQEQLLDIVERKTAYLFSGCTKLPAIAAGLNHGAAERLGEAGKCLGMAFQLTDDLLDLTSTREAMGKPVANDLKEGKMTLPVSFVVRNGGAEDTGKVRTVLEERDFRSVERKEILSLVEKHGGVARTRQLAEEYARQAEELLKGFPPSVYRDAIISIPAFILNRNS